MNGSESISLNVVGLGLIFYSPFAASHIREGEDYLETAFEYADFVEQQALAGHIVGVSTGSPGRFVLNLFSGYPIEEAVGEHQFKLRLGVEVRDGTLCVRDLFDLLDWDPKCPESQCIGLNNGFYHVTLLSNTPKSGVLGDNQEISVYLQPLNEMPQLRFNGVPTLC